MSTSVITNERRRNEESDMTLKNEDENKVDPNRFDVRAEVDPRQPDSDEQRSQRRHFPNKTSSSIFADSTPEDNKRLHRTFGF